MVSFGFRRDIANSRLDLEVAGVNALQMTKTAVTLPAAITSGLTIVAGGLTVTAGGVTVTAGGLTVTAGDLTLTAGGLTYGGSTAKTQETNHTTGVTFDPGGALAGVITLASVDLGTEAHAVFTVTNAAVAVGDVVVACIGDVEVAGSDVLQMTKTAVTIPSGVTGGLTVVAGGATATAGGLTVTAGGLEITAGGLTITAGGLTVAGRGTVAQGAGSGHATPFTIDAFSGIITLDSTDLGTGAEIRMVVSNNKVAAGDVIALCIGDYADPSGMGTATVEDVGAGVFTILLSETTGANSFNDGTTLNFVVIQNDA